MNNYQQIFEICWKELQDHKDNDEPLYLSEKDRALSYQYAGSDEKEVSDDKAKLYLMRWIMEQHKQYGKIYMYTCKDNGLISFDPADDENELEDYAEKQDTELEFYIGFD